MHTLTGSHVELCTEWFNVYNSSSKTMTSLGFSLIVKMYHAEIENSRQTIAKTGCLTGSTNNKAGGETRKINLTAKTKWE